MTTLTSSPPQPVAVAAFLRGLDRRARLLAQVQAGDADAARRALAASARVFAAEADQWPLAQWPSQYWRLLLSAPAMRQPAAGSATSPLPGITRLAPPVRAAVLLHLVAGLEDTDASTAMGIGIDTYQQRIRDALPRDPLGQPDIDVWRAWRAAAQRELDKLPEATQDAASSAASPPRPSRPPEPDDGTRRHRRRLRWLWLGVGACAVALAATFFLHPRGRELLDQWRTPQVTREALPPADAPKARFDAADPALHPDHDLLAAPDALRQARMLPLLAWLTANTGEMPASETPAAASATIEDGDITGRMQAWDRLSPRQRATRRGAWREWQALTDVERTALRATAARFDALPIDQQQAVRSRYAQLPFDAHRGWHLGPQLGRDWPRIVALFAQVDAGEREPLLQLLRDATPEDIEALARLAQTTPPEARAALRRDLLTLPPAQRAAWLQAKLHD